MGLLKKDANYRCNIGGFGTSEYNTAFGAFGKEHFPLSWSIAKKMSDDEIKAMIDGWRKSVK